MSKCKIPFNLVIDLGLVLAVLYTRLLTHAEKLTKWDSVQFALGLSDFDITRHQPHPPGYPGYIGLARLIRQFVPDDNLSLIIVGIISGMLLAVAVHNIGRILLGPRAGFFAGILAALNPLLWYFSDVALSYMMGVAIATAAIWIGCLATGRAKVWAPILAGISSLGWPYAGFFVLPVCFWLWIRPPANEKDRVPGQSIWSVVWFLILFAVPILAGYLPIILYTGAGAYFGAIGGESGKHITQISQWLQSPLDEFVRNTESLALFFKQGLGMGRWLFLALLIPLAGEIGVRPTRLVGLLPLFFAALLSVHWGATAPLRTAGILASIFSLAYLLPKPAAGQGRFVRRLFLWWLGPGLVFFIFVYANYVGVLLILLPALVLLEGWAIDRAANFMSLQTVRESVAKKGEEAPRPAKGPDMRVEKFVAWFLMVLMAMHEVGAFVDRNSQSQESWRGIIARDQFVSDVVEAVKSAPIPMSNLIVLGGEDDYRHWTYYLPETTVIWTKYVLYRDIRPGVGVWVSHDRHQNMTIPEIITTDDSPEAIFDLAGSRGVVVFPPEFAMFAGSGTVILLGGGEPNGEKIEPVAYLLETGPATRLIFQTGKWWLE
jgi:4-amino-4-deoxy-L-arabinose transferase-like glycosyltransferase